VGKNPAFLFYPSDWDRDMASQSLEIRGVWITILSELWWSKTKGKKTMSLTEWAHVLHADRRCVARHVTYLLERGIASGQYLDNQNITLISRRMIKDEEIRKIRQEVGKLGGNPGLLKIQHGLLNQNEKQKDRSSVSVSVIKDKEEKTIAPTDRKRSNRIRPPSTPKEYFIWFDEQIDWFLGQHMETLKKAYPGVDLKVESDKMKGWIRGNYSKRKSDIGRFMTRWYKREQDGGFYSSTPKSLPRQPLGLWADTKPEPNP